MIEMPALSRIGAGARATTAAALVLVVGLLLPGAALAADPVDPGSLLAGVNLRRAADGMPALSGDPKMDQGCLNHVNYGLLNYAGGFPDDPHDEIPGKPGYTELGRKAAGRSVLGYGVLNGGRPFHHAPGHLFHFLSPFPLKAGLAERTDGAHTLGCAWFANADADDVEQRRTPSAPPRQWSVPFDGQTGVAVWESHFDAPPTNLFEAGYTSNPNGPALAGPVLQLYQEDVGATRLDALCQSVLLAPGGQPVVAAPLTRGQLVVRDPLLPSARYRQVSTFTDAPGCQGSVQRTGSSSFVTAAPRKVEDVVTLTDPFLDTDGHWKAKAAIGEELGYFAKGNGTIDFTFTMGDPQYYVHWRDAYWNQGGSTVWLDQGPVGQVLTLKTTPDALAFGPTCYGPARSVRRSYVHQADGTIAAQGPEEVIVAPGGDACTAPPTVAGRTPAGGGPGTVVRISGGAITRSTRVRFGGVDASRWRADGADLLVTVPNGAADGPIRIDTPFGSAMSSAFDVTADTTPPVTELQAGPSGTTGATATFVFDAEPGSQASCSLDGAPPTPCTSPVSYQGLGSGAHSFAVRTTDPAGHVEVAPVARAWTVGAPPPTSGTPGGSTVPAGSSPTGDAPASGGPGPATGSGGASPPGGDGSATNAGGTTPKPPARRESVLVRAGAVRVVRGVRRKGRRLTLGTLTATRRATATLTVRSGRRRLLRIKRRLRAGQRVPVVLTLPKSLAKRRKLLLTVTLGTQTARLTVRR